MTREPGGTPLAEQLRALALNEPMDALTEALLMFAARRDHLLQVIEPALARGEVVLCDRFTDATFAYQGHGRGFDLAVLAQLERWVQRVPALGDGSLRNPDLTLWFDLKPEIAAQRLAGARLPDKFESQPVDFFRRVAAGYAARAAGDPARFARIEADQPRDAVWQAVRSAHRGSGAGCHERHGALDRAHSCATCWRSAVTPGCCRVASGLGQYELALELARAWLCDEPGPAGACGHCASCHAIDVRAHTDLCVLMPETAMLALGWPLSEKAQTEIDDKARKPSKEIRVDAMRDAVEFAQRTSGRGRGKAVLVYPAERMNAITANALLKTLEEPAGDLRFVLASEAAHQLLPTIRSRCLGHAMVWPAPADAARWLQEQGMDAAEYSGAVARRRWPSAGSAVARRSRAGPQGLGAAAQGAGSRRRRCAGRVDAAAGASPRC